VVTPGLALELSNLWVEIEPQDAPGSSDLFWLMPIASAMIAAISSGSSKDARLGQHCTSQDEIIKVLNVLSVCQILNFSWLL